MIELTKHNKIISALWAFGILAFIGYVYFAVNETNPEYRTNLSLITTQEIITVLIVLIVLAILSIILKSSTFRLTNIIGGSILGIGFLAVFIDAFTVNLSGIYNLMAGADVIIMIIIIILSYRLPKS